MAPSDTTAAAGERTTSLSANLLSLLPWLFLLYRTLRWAPPFRRMFLDMKVELPLETQVAVWPLLPWAIGGIVVAFLVLSIVLPRARRGLFHAACWPGILACGVFIEGLFSPLLRVLEALSA